MFNNLPCGAGLRRDCMKRVCLARHIDDDKTMENNPIKSREKQQQTDEDKQIEIAIKRSLEEKQQCQFCEKEVKSKDELIIHVNECHTEEEKGDALPVQGKRRVERERENKNHKRHTLSEEQNHRRIWKNKKKMAFNWKLT